MVEEIESYVFQAYEDDDGSFVTTCELFPMLCGVGDDVSEAAEDLAAEIADYLRRVVYH